MSFIEEKTYIEFFYMKESKIGIEKFTIFTNFTLLIELDPLHIRY